jgi:photosystem II stability/assembly factor-like uncharacterized protein
MNRVRRLYPALFAALALVSAASAQIPADISPWLNSLTARNIGPNTMGGRISDLAVYEKDPRVFYVATASGGLFKTENGGFTLNPVFDREGSVSLGGVAVSQKNPNLVWVGTGEASSRNSVAWGDGVYKSEDGGKTWANMGLKETMHISKVVIDPRNDNHVYVAALGRLWGENPERGVYKTTDGGKSWNLVLKVDNKTGCIDLALHPKNPEILLAAMWQRERKAYDFSSGGPGSGMYRTSNAGRSWTKVSKGLPTATLGRIGLDFFRPDPTKVIATVEFKPSDDELKSINARRLGGFNNGGLFLSTDTGQSWKFTSANNNRPFYFSLPRFDTVDPNRIYLPSVNLDFSRDGGKTYRVQDNRVHPDYHVFWINPKDPMHIIAGTDGGLFETRDQGNAWRHLNGMAIGQFYAIGVDTRRPYWVYGGLQDNQNWGTPTQTASGRILASDIIGLGGGDGFYNQADPNDWRTVYGESQGGAAFRVDLITGATRSIRPRGQALRFNWNAPFILSAHNSRVIYFGANKLMKSVNRGESWDEISPDLTSNDPAKLNPGQQSVTPENTGAERHCTIVTIGESPITPGLIYVGTDDGFVHLTRDDGKTWTNLTSNFPDLPAGLWCSRVTASKHEAGRAYATFDGHRSNDFKSYVYVTEDFGKTWTKLNNGLPDYDSIYVIKEGQINPDLLFLGSEMSLRVSLDRGKNWTRYRTGSFPTVAVHDLVIHPVELDLVVATHGRSIWTLDVSGLERMTAKTVESDAAIFPPQDVLLLGRTNPLSWAGDEPFAVQNTQPGTTIQYWLKADASDVKLSISNADGTQTYDFPRPSAKAGLNAVRWNGRLGRLQEAGEYSITLTVGGKSYRSSVKVVDAYIPR